MPDSQARSREQDQKIGGFGHRHARLSRGATTSDPMICPQGFVDSSLRWTQYEASEASFLAVIFRVKIVQWKGEHSCNTSQPFQSSTARMCAAQYPCFTPLNVPYTIY